MYTRKLFLFLTFFLPIILACNLSQSSPIATKRDATTLDTPAGKADDEIFVEETLTAEPLVLSTQTVVENKVTIVGTPGIINCALLDVAKFDSIVNKEYSFIGADQDGCVYIDSNTSSYLTILPGIHGIKQMSVDAVRNEFDNLVTKFNSNEWISSSVEWKSYPEGYQLGMVAYFGSVGSNDTSGAITVYGILSNGYAMYIVANDRSSSSNINASQQKIIKLIEEVAWQLNKQW